MQLFHSARLVISVAELAGLPDAALPEIACAGRSNAGKSTAINVLTQQKRLAFASKTPGRTQLLNFFELSERDDQGQTVPVTKNAQEFVDYIRLLALTGARMAGALNRWADVDWVQRQITIGADADTKNRECLRVVFNVELEAHLKAMFSRRAPDSEWMLKSC